MLNKKLTGLPSFVSGVLLFVLQMVLLTLTHSQSERLTITFLIITLNIAVHYLINHEPSDNKVQTFKRIFKKENRHSLGLGFVIYLGVVLLQMILPTNPNNIMPNNQQNFLDAAPLTVINLSLLLILTSAFEELVFREFLPNTVQTKKEPIILMTHFVSSTFFLVAHPINSFKDIIVYGFIAYAFMFIRLRKGHIRHAVYAHIGYNLCTLIVLLALNL